MTSLRKPYLAFIEIPAKGVTKRWRVEAAPQSGTFAGDIVLGEVRWFSHWRRYAFFPGNKTIFEVQCLIELTKHLDYQTALRKQQRALERAEMGGLT